MSIIEVLINFLNRKNLSKLQKYVREENQYGSGYPNNIIFEEVINMGDICTDIFCNEIRSGSLLALRSFKKNLLFIIHSYN